jgi:O-antigen/teichoic acid export membrane protein
MTIATLIFKRFLEILQELRQSKFVRNVVILVTGTAAAQVISMAFSPVVTRLYGPEAFGLLGTFTALVGVLTPIAALCYPIAIVLPKNDEDAKGIARLSAYSAAIVACLFTLLLWGAGGWVINSLKIFEIKDFIIFIPFLVFFSALTQIFQQWLIRKKLFRITARVAVLQALIINSAKTGLGFVKPVGAALIVLVTFGTALHALMLAIGAKKTFEKKDIKEEGSRRSLLSLAKQYYDFPVFRAPQVCINAISHSLPVLMLSAFFGPASAGFYTLCKTVLGMPSQLIGKSVGDVFYPRIVEAEHNGENLSCIILKATLVLSAVGFVPFALVVAFGPWIFGFVFGKEWMVAGEYARWLSLWMFFMFINKPSVVAIPVLKLQKGLMIYELGSMASKLLALYMGFYLYGEDVFAVALFSIFGVAAYTVLILWVLLSSRNRFMEKFNIVKASR